jgi:translation initiation factor IF-2
MSKVRINDLARELEVKSRQILDILAELGLGAGKTHSSSLEEDEAEKVRVQFAHGSRAASHGGAARGAQAIQPKIDLSHISKMCSRPYWPRRRKKRKRRVTRMGRQSLP